MTNKRQKAIKVKCKRKESQTKQPISPRETSPAAKSEAKRMFSQATNYSKETKEILVEWEQILPTKYLHSDHTDKALGMRVRRVRPSCLISRQER